MDTGRWGIGSRSDRQRILAYAKFIANILRRGQLLELRRKQAVILDKDDGKRWLISYAAINMDGADVQIREQPQQQAELAALASR